MSLQEKDIIHFTYLNYLITKPFVCVCVFVLFINMDWKERSMDQFWKY